MPAPLGRLLGEGLAKYKGSFVIREAARWERDLFWSILLLGEPFSKACWKLALQTTVYIIMPSGTRVSEHCRWGGPGYTQVPPDPGNFENDPLNLFSVAQSYWWVDLVFVASQRTSSADWLSPGLGTTYLCYWSTILLKDWPHIVHCIDMLVMLIQCGMWQCDMLVLSTFAVTWQW